MDKESEVTHARISINKISQQIHDISPDALKVVLHGMVEVPGAQERIDIPLRLTSGGVFSVDPLEGDSLSIGEWRLPYISTLSYAEQIYKAQLSSAYTFGSASNISIQNCTLEFDPNIFEVTVNRSMGGW